MYTEDIVFEKTDFRNVSFRSKEYENCTFIHCDFSGVDMAETKFINCSFTGCNLSLVKLTETVFRDVAFDECKMIGVLFCDCNKFGLSFRFNTCTLDHSSFHAIKIRKTIFRDCQMQEVDFTFCDLTGAVLSNCNLKDARFENTILETADLRMSYHYSIDPTINKIRKASFSLSTVAGLLDMFAIRIDRTT